MTEQTGWYEAPPEQPSAPAEPGSAAEDVAPPAPDPSQEPPAETPAPESDTAPEPAAAEPATDPGPPPVYVPDGQPSWLTDLITWFDERLRKLGG